MSSEIMINTAEPVKARVAESKKPSNVGIVLAHDVFGIDKDIEERIEYWSTKGYRVVVPDLYSLGQKVSVASVEELDSADAIRSAAEAFDVDQGLGDIAGAVAFARQQGCHGVGVMGFGLGGLLAYLAAAKTDCDAAIGYVPVGVERRLDFAGVIERPLSLYFAAEDDLVDKGAREKIAQAFARHPSVRVLTHPFVRRGFARWDSSQRDRCALTLAEHLAGEFFYMNLTLKHWRTRPASPSESVEGAG